ncbi:hypothetical protein E4U60_001991 [Claviceps pazoutovae]|uniref:Uncharacterized protein n=1 Tax=Claviceps pazoutovae TaxID=1649127 RepID=A0A9P7SGC4_9HYPO|nr:hypothetical protein E4U60_001991 [Claviceps pazoutovae]
MDLPIPFCAGIGVGAEPESDRQQRLLEAAGPLSTIDPAESTATTSNAAPPDHESLADELDIGQRIAILFSADDDGTGCVGAETSKHG